MSDNNLQAEMLVASKIRIGTQQGDVPPGAIGIIDRIDFNDMVWVIFEKRGNECTQPLWCHSSEVQAI